MATVRKSFPVVVFLGAAMLVGTVYGQGVDYDVYKYSQDGTTVPDVDKAGVPPGPPLAGDLSCWQATASNLLGGAGYGTGVNAQARADSIYNQLTIGPIGLGLANPGFTDRAINWWLYNYGKNPSSAEYQPTNPYTDVTAVYKTLTYTPGAIGSDYDFLLDELNRCQYVGVGFNMESSDGHALTLVGGNYASTAQPTGNVSIWHDSDRDKADTVVSIDDDVYINATHGADWYLSDYPTLSADSYTTLCPGLNKPEDAVRNYDVAYFMQALDANQVLDDPAFRVAGENAGVYADPIWEDETTVQIGNLAFENMKKEVYLLVDYYDRVVGRESQEQILLQVEDPAQGTLDLDPTSVEASLDGGQLLFTWLLDFQPGWENIIFPDNRYSTLSGNVKDWNVATDCVPEPSSIVLLIVGAISAMAYGWRRRRVS